MATTATGATSDPIRIGNFFSTFDTESVIQQLTAARSVPLQQIDDRETQLKAQKGALASLQSVFSQLLTAATNLSQISSVSGRTASASASAVSAAASPSAALGSFTVAVTSTATATSITGPALSAGIDAAALLQSANLATPATAGTFTIATATGGSHTFTLDPATQSLNDVVAQINGAGIGVTATVANDANGRPNILQLSSAQGAISLGTGGDTSNFLSAMNLLASPGTTTRASTLGVARLNPAATLSAESFEGGAPAAGAHTFTINGVSIAYDASKDSLNDVITRINSSAAGVTATYDSVSDTLKLQQKSTGSIGIALADDGAGGDFLAKTGLLTASQTLGSNAQYSVNGGPALYSSTNTVSYNGVSLTLNAATDPASPVTVTVGQDATAAVGTVTAFLSAFNATLNVISDATQANGQDTTQSGPLVGDASILSLQSSLRTMVTSQATGGSSSYKTLSQIGISFGPVGSAVGTTNQLQFDEAKFRSALASDPASVQALLSQYQLSPTLTGAGSIASVSGQYVGTKAGSYAITDDGAGNLTAVFTPTDGSAATTATATATAGGTNTTLVPGITLQFGGALVAGTQTLTIAPSLNNVISQVKDFLTGEVGTGGTLALRMQSYDTRLKDMDAQKDRIQASIDAEMQVIRNKFIAMEQAQAQAQSILQSLQQATQPKSN